MEYVFLKYMLLLLIACGSPLLLKNLGYLPVKRRPCQDSASPNQEIRAEVFNPEDPKKFVLMLLCVFFFQWLQHSMIVTSQVFAVFIFPAGSMLKAELAVSSVYIEIAYVLQLWVGRLEDASSGPENPCLAFLFCSEKGITLTNNYGYGCVRKIKRWQHHLTKWSCLDWRRGHFLFHFTALLRLTHTRAERCCLTFLYTNFEGFMTHDSCFGWCAFIVLI